MVQGKCAERLSGAKEAVNSLRSALWFGKGRIHLLTEIKRAVKDDKGVPMVNPHINETASFLIYFQNFLHRFKILMVQAGKYSGNQNSIGTGLNELESFN